MTIYTGIADANGDFIVPFSSNYTGGQKITVIAEKDAATKTIELFAPSDVVGGGVIQFGGNLSNFPANIGDVLISIGGQIANYTFSASPGNILWNQATGLTIDATTIGRNAFENWGKATFLIMSNNVTALGYYTFQNWGNATQLTISSNLTAIPDSCFSGWSKLINIIIPDSVKTIAAGGFVVSAQCNSVDIGTGIISMSAQAIIGLSGCNAITCRALIPPTIKENTFNGLKETCIFKVPAGSVSAYQAAPNWSAFASRIQAI